MNTLEKLVESVEKCLAENNYYAALGIALALPDICGKLENPTKNSSERFKFFFDTYLKKNYEFIVSNEQICNFTATDCYALRCSFLHEASDDISNQRAQEILNKFKFTTSNYHNIWVMNVLVLNVSDFCNEITKGVKDWLQTIANSQEIQIRLNQLIKIEEQDFNPHPGVRIG